MIGKSGYFFLGPCLLIIFGSLMKVMFLPLCLSWCVIFVEVHALPTSFTVNCTASIRLVPTSACNAPGEATKPSGGSTFTTASQVPSTDS